MAFLRRMRPDIIFKLPYFQIFKLIRGLTLLRRVPTAAFSHLYYSLRNAFTGFATAAFIL